MIAYRPTIDELIEAFHRGANRAHKLHESWTGGEWLNAGPEYLLTTYVAESIGKLKGNQYVSLEYSVKTAIAEAGARRRGKLREAMRPNGRADLLVWDDTAPRGVIEIKKRNFGFGQLKKDVERIESMLERQSSLEFGAIGLYLYRCSNESARASVKTALGNLSTAFEKKTSVSVNWESFPSKVYGDRDDAAWAWASSIFVAQR